MIGKRGDNRIDNLTVRRAAASDLDVRLGVGGSLLARQALEGSLGVVVAKQGPGIASRRAVGEHVNRSVEPDGDRVLLEQSAGAWIDEHAAAGCDHSHLAVDQARDEPSLAVAVIAFTEAFENFARRIAYCVLDLGIAVDEGQTQPPGKAAPDGRLASAHQADENYWTVEMLGKILHGRGYTAAPKLGQKPPSRSSKQDVMRRFPLLIILVLLLVGLVVFLSMQAREVPTRTIETDVSQGTNAQ